MVYIPNAVYNIKPVLSPLTNNSDHCKHTFSIHSETIFANYKLSLQTYKGNHRQEERVELKSNDVYWR